MVPAMKQNSTKVFHSLFSGDGERKYLISGERQAFVVAAKDEAREVRTFCGTLAYTGCRISEALATTIDLVDVAALAIRFESLKKRRAGIYRSVPVLESFIEELDLVHGIRSAQASKSHGKRVRLWPWSRTTGWRIVKRVLSAAGVSDGCYASPKGLRHAFGVGGVLNDVPLNMIQKWLGHGSITTTTIYANAVGAEEREMAKRMWAPRRGSTAVPAPLVPPQSFQLAAEERSQ
jgi:integrase/recombinase XerD